MTSLGKRRVLGDADFRVGLNMDQKEIKNAIRWAVALIPYLCDFKRAMTKG